MLAANHIVGGAVITGTFCSLFNVNIFENPYTIAITVFASVLPDIDHTKSIIGKVFYPIAKMISVKFGHRTITHSIFFFLISSLLVWFLEKHFLGSFKYSLIYFFALLSHLILDMVTVQGIPLFYPFAKNPCVIPANPDLRLRSNNLKQEGIALFIFAILSGLLQPMFSNGFWSTYNNQFNSITHVIREFSTTEKAIELTYDYTWYNKKITGSGIVVSANQKGLSIVKNDNTLVNINADENTIINEFQIRKTDSVIEPKEVVFSNIIVDSLYYLVENKYILKADIFSNNQIIFDGSRKTHFKYENEFNPKMPIIPNEKDEGFIKVQQRYREKYLEYQKQVSEKSSISKAISKIELRLSQDLDNYEKESLQKQLIEQKMKLANHKIDRSNLSLAESELKNFPSIGETKFNGIATLLLIK